MKLAVLSNVKSGRGQAPCIPDHIAHARTANEDEALEALKRFAADGIDTLVIHGGDGTLDSAIRLMREHDIFEREPVIALLNGGTTNMTWRDVGLARFDDLIKGEDLSVIERRVIKVESGTMDAQYGFFFGCGAIPRTIRKARMHMHSRGITGPLGEVFLLVQTIVKLLIGRIYNDSILRPTPVEYRIGTEHKTVESVLLLGTTLQRLVLGLQPVASQDYMGVVSINAPYKNFVKIWFDVFGKNSSPINRYDLFRFYNNSVALSFDGAWTLDGELFESDAKTPLSLSIDAPVRFFVERGKS